MSNKNTQKTAAANGGGKKQRAKVSDTSIDNISDATRKKIEKIKTVTEWQVSEDIFNLLRDCNFDENLTIEKIITGDAGHPGEEWKEVTRQRKQKEPPAAVEVQQPDKRSGKEKQNRGRPMGARGGRANGQPGGKRPPFHQQKRVGDNRTVPQERDTATPTSGAPTTQQIVQQYSPSPSAHSPPSRGSASQRPQSNGRRPVGTGQQVRGSSPTGQHTQGPQGQVHVHSQPPLQSQPQTQQTAPLIQEHMAREPDVPQRLEQARPPAEQSSQKVQEETHLQNQHQVLQAQQGERSQTRGATKKAPGKGQFGQTNSQSTHSHPNKTHPPAIKGRRTDNFVWQAKEATATSLTQVPTTRAHSPQNLPIRSTPEPQIARQSSPVPTQTSSASLSTEETQADKAAVILPSDLNAYDSDDTDASMNLHFGNFGTSAPTSKVDVLQRQASSAVGRPPVSRPVTTPLKEQSKDLQPVPTSQSTTSQPPQPRKTATHPPEKKPTSQQPQQPVRSAPGSAMGMESSLGDDMAYGSQSPHMQMNPQAFSSYNPGHFHFLPGTFAMSDIDQSTSLPHHSQMNFYEAQGFPQASYRASSPHQGDVSPKYQGQFREPKYSQQTPQASSPVQDRHDKHRQESGSPPPRGSQQHPQSPQSPPPGQHPSQPQPLPYSVPASGAYAPQIYGYPYQYGYPAASSQFTTGYSRYPMHYPKHFAGAPNSGGYPLSPPTSAGYPEDVQMLAGDYNKYMPVMQSFFHTGMTDPSSGGAPTHMGIGGKAQTTPPSSTTQHGTSMPPSKPQQSSFPAAVSSVGQASDMSTSIPYKDYSGDLRGASAGTYYKGYSGQPTTHHTPPSQYGQAQYGQQTGQYQGNGQGQFPFMHHQPHPHHLMQGQQQQPQQQN